MNDVFFYKPCIYYHLRIAHHFQNHYFDASYSSSSFVYLLVDDVSCFTFMVKYSLRVSDQYSVYEDVCCNRVTACVDIDESSI